MPVDEKVKALVKDTTRAYEPYGPDGATYNEKIAQEQEYKPLQLKWNSLSAEQRKEFVKLGLREVRASDLPSFRRLVNTFAENGSYQSYLQRYESVHINYRIQPDYNTAISHDDVLTARREIVGNLAMAKTELAAARDLYAAGQKAEAAEKHAIAAGFVGKAAKAFEKVEDAEDAPNSPFKEAVSDLDLALSMVKAEVDRYERHIASEQKLEAGKPKKTKSPPVAANVSPPKGDETRMLKSISENTLDFDAIKGGFAKASALESRGDKGAANEIRKNAEAQRAKALVMVQSSIDRSSVVDRSSVAMKEVSLRSLQYQLSELK